MAIYKGDTKVAGGNIKLDGFLSATSNNPVPNSVITSALENVGYSTWQKPADWIDIRSGALPKSIYLLVGHKEDYLKYRYINFHIVLSDTTHNFKVYIDYKLYGTYASGADVKLDWQTLALTTGIATTTPEALITHVIRIVPENSADTITAYDNNRYGTSGNEQQGILWAHFTQNEMSLVKFTKYINVYQPLLTAITALDDKLHITGTDMNGWIAESLDQYTRRSGYLAKLPIIEVDTLTSFGSLLNHTGPLKKAKLIVNNSISASGASGGNAASFCSGNIEEVEINKPITLGSGTTNSFSLFRVSNLKKLPVIDFSSVTRLVYFLTNNTNLKDTVLDLTEATSLKSVNASGSSSKNMLGLQGVIVSSSAPFDIETSPQINVSYTGLDRAALINLFNSMPYNVGYNVTGSPTIADGIASGFTTSDYAYLSMPFVDDGNDFEYAIAFNSNTTNNAAIAGVTNGYNAQRPCWSLYNSGCVRFKIASGETIATTTTISTGVDYQAILSRTGTTYTLKLYSGTTLLETQTLTSETLVGAGGSNTFAFGFDKSTYNTAFNGSIDFNNTYIKRKGVIWFSGMAAMTKACSVVGCTGTADLTAADKAIATGKGWELTVA